MRTPGLGFSLTELMIATALLSTVTAGGLAALARARAARHEAGALQQLHERAQHVFATLEPELQMAGYFGFTASPPRIRAADVPEPARRCGPELVARLDLPVQVAPAWELPCEARGGGAADGASVLTVRRVSAHVAATAETGRAQWLSRVSDPADDALFWNGEAPWTPAAIGHGAELRELIVRIYYVARAADGDASLPALRVKSLTSIAGVPAFIDTEVMNGIEDLQVEVLPAATTPRSVRVRLRVRADGAGLQPGTPPRSLEIARHFSLRNARD